MKNMALKQVAYHGGQKSKPMRKTHSKLQSVNKLNFIAKYATQKLNYYKSKMIRIIKNNCVNNTENRNNYRQKITMI